MKSNHRSLTIYIDGASQGNPGKAGIGIVIYNENGERMKEISKSIGIATNNVAEYIALIFALQEALLLNCRKELIVYTDSELLYKQLKGLYKVRDDTLKILFQLAQHLIASYKNFHTEYIDRNSNKIADKLATQATKIIKIP